MRIDGRTVILTLASLVIIIAVIVGFLMFKHETKTQLELVKSLVENAKYEFKLESTAFPNGGEIPKKYTCDGENISPPLKWSGIQGNVKSLLLLVYDPDAPSGFFVHWVIVNMPPSISELPENIPNEEYVENVGYQLKNDFGYFGYGGPCPPPGKPHRYVFILLALDAEVPKEMYGDLAEILEYAKAHVVGYAVLLGYYGR